MVEVSKRRTRSYWAAFWKPLLNCFLRLIYWQKQLTCSRRFSIGRISYEQKLIKAYTAPARTGSIWNRPGVSTSYSTPPTGRDKLSPRYKLFILLQQRELFTLNISGFFLTSFLHCDAANSAFKIWEWTLQLPQIPSLKAASWTLHFHSHCHLHQPWKQRKHRC